MRRRRQSFARPTSGSDAELSANAEIAA